MNSNAALSAVLTPIFNNIVEPGLLFLAGLALVYLIWGIFSLIRGAASEEARTTGQQHILWASIGLFIMVGAWGIIRVIANTINAPTPF